MNKSESLGRAAAKQSCGSAVEPAKLVWGSGAACSRPDAGSGERDRAEALGAETLLPLAALRSLGEFA